MFSPLVSIIIPLYNGSNFVREAIDSALNQTYTNIEIIVVNDGSNDGGLSRDAVLEYGSKVKYFEKPNSGCASALNYGIKMASGKYISWLSHDDLYFKDKIEREVKCYEELGLPYDNCLISARGALINESGDPIVHPNIGRNGHLDPLQAFEYLLLVRCFNGCGLLIPKSVFDKGLWFDETKKYLLDWILWLKLAVNGYEFYVLQDDLVYNRCHGGQVTVYHGNLKEKEENEIVLELSELLKDCDDEYALLLYKFAYRTKSKYLPEVSDLLKSKQLKKPVFSCIILRLKYRLRNIAKEIYHKFR